MCFSWACIRYQCIDPTYTEAKVSEHNKEHTVEHNGCQWNYNADDWGSEGDDENGNIENGRYLLLGIIVWELA